MEGSSFDSVPCREGQILIRELFGFGKDILYSIPENITVSEFVEREVYLPMKVSDRPGPISFRDSSYVYECLEDFEDTSARDICNCFGSQVYKTAMMMCGILERIDRNPINWGWVMPNEKLAQSFAETKMKPMLDSSPAIARHKPSNANEFKILEWQFDRCIGTFLGSGAQKNLKGRSIGIIVIDEPDDVEEEYASRGESAIGLAEARTKSFADSKRFLNGTPTIPSAPVWQGFLLGDRRLRFVTCSRCTGPQFVIEFDPQYIREWFPYDPETKKGTLAAKVVWDQNAKHESGEWNWDKVEDSARIECPNCKALLGEDEKRQMCRRENGAVWKATNPNSPRGYRSRRLPAIYSPHESTTIGKTAIKFLKAKDKPGALRNFINEELALPFQQRASVTTVGDIKAVIAASPEYLRGEIPRDNIALLSLTVDVNQGLFHWVIRAWFADKSSALVDYGPCLSWEALLEISKKKYRVGKTSLELSPMFCLIDSGWRTKQESGVYDFCLNISAGRFYPVKGATKSQGLKRTIEESVVDWKGRNVTLIRFDEPILKYDLYFNKIKSRDSKWWLPKNIGKDYEAQLTDEYLKDTKEGQEWDSKEKNNHLGDCEKEQLIIPSLIEGIEGIDGMGILAKRIAAKVAA
jgi:phage terminase large subunit GpA-like protein